MKMFKNLLLVLVILIISSFIIANAPEPFWACNGLQEGDECEPYSTSGCKDVKGECVLQEECNDNPDTDVNECLFCERMN